jgi:hypothetical protein
LVAVVAVVAVVAALPARVEEVVLLDSDQHLQVE